ncbi:zinc finger protein 723-like isoform X1 [Euwallacea similis]|uniref:zinc finger protein 723-like isoform X1 n=2 Tax=Euwallacea similis TaxID=1736056 RepID=UPI00344D1EB5
MEYGIRNKELSLRINAFLSPNKMQDKEIVCPQCLNIPTIPSNRLVQDSCGHVKCRTCLLKDSEFCKQCLTSKKKNGNNLVPIEKLSPLPDNHTAVICNGRNQISNSIAAADNIVNDGITHNNAEDVKVKLEEIKEVKKDEVEQQEKSCSKKRAISIPSHITIKSDPVCYFCTLCNKTFTTKGHIKYHRFCSGESKPFKCEKCSKEFILKVQLDIHMWKHQNVKPLKCSFCTKMFSERSKLRRHEALHSTKMGFMCPQCGKSFKVRDSLRVHSLIHKSEKPFSCKLCPAKFSHSSNLKKHLVSHSDEKVHMCDQCGRRFKLKGALSVHRRSHSNIRPHVCDNCSKSFVNLKDLQRHLIIHSDVKQFTCGICLMTFRRKDILQRHMKNTHPGKKGDIIKNAVHVADAPKKSAFVDNPNAVNVITASPALTSKCRADPAAVPIQQPPTISTDSRPAGSTVINGPIKLAFKTPAFKSNYNITGGGEPVPSSHLTQDFSLTSTAHSEVTRPDLEPLQSSDLAPFSSVLHYETSFQNRKHAMIKNIKFKVPARYTNSLKTSTNNNPNGSDVSTKSSDQDSHSSNTSVIVNNSCSDVHWRRRTSQGLVLKD